MKNILNKIKQLSSYILKNASLLITKVVKPSNTLVFCSYPSFSDNSYALYKYIVTNGLFEGYRLVWIVLDKNDTLIENIPQEIAKNSSIVLYNKSIKSLYTYLRAKHVFITHGLYSNFSITRPNTVVNLWHGMPLKKICKLIDNKSTYLNNVQISIATSELYQGIIASCFGKSINEVIITGQPRNDLMFEPSDFYTIHNIPKSKYSKIGIWLPTFRATVEHKASVDGNYEENKIGFLDKFALFDFNNFLMTNNIFIIIKLHPSDLLQNTKFNSFSNLLILKHSDLKTQLYPLIGSTDFLITDYSSVWIDYDILEKPIGFIIDDYKQYKDSRGFIFDNLEKHLPGELIENITDLKNFVTNNNLYLHKTKDIYNMYKDNKSTERILNHILGNRNLPSI